MKIRHSLRISLSLVGLTLFIIFIAYGLGFIPDESESRLRARIDVTEALAVIFTVAAQHKDMELIPLTIKSVVERNSNIESIFIKKTDDKKEKVEGAILLKKNEIKSTPDKMKIPIFKKNKIWAVLEVNFIPLKKKYLWNIIDLKFMYMLLFVAIFGFIIYLFLISKALRYMDPYQMIPERVRLALNALTEGVVLMDDKEYIVLSNKSFEKKINLESHQLSGKKLSLLNWCSLSGSAGGETQFPWNEAMIDGNIKENVMLKYKIADNEIHTFIVNSTPLRDKSDKVKGVLSSFSDVSEIEIMNQELENMASFLRHETGNALLGAAGTIKLLEESEHLSDNDKQLLHRAQRSHRIIRHLLDRASEAKTVKSSFEEDVSTALRLDVLVSETAASYAAIYKNNRFSFNTDGREMILSGQEERIIQMLDKLVSNAVDYSAKETEIVISCNRKQGNAVIKVLNQGEPLPDNKQKIFDLYASFRKHTSNGHNQGIGLYVVKLIAETYGGSVEARDRKDVTGAEFKIVLPIIL